MTKTLLPLSRGQERDLNDKQRALIQLGVTNDRLNLVDAEGNRETNFVLINYFESNYDQIANAAIAEVKAINEEKEAQKIVVDVKKKASNTSK